MDFTALRQALVSMPAAPRPQPAPAATTTTTSRPTGALRVEIQALRAVAVALVVVYHLWNSAVPGGFVGVDVFFVISGFLITSLLLREVERTGRISLRDFWARRARRILPAALVVIGACLAATAIWVPVTAWSQYFGDLRASTLYVQNWHLAHAAVDYFSAEQAPSPVQHFWSLAVEEQFYLVWPLLLLGVTLLTRRLPAGARRSGLALAVARGAPAARPPAPGGGAAGGPRAPPHPRLRHPPHRVGPGRRLLRDDHPRLGARRRRPAGPGPRPALERPRPRRAVRDRPG